MPDDTLELTYIDVHARAAADLDQQLKRIGDAVSAKLKDAAATLGTAFDQAAAKTGDAATKTAQSMDKVGQAAEEAAKSTDKVGAAAAKVAEDAAKVGAAADKAARDTAKVGDAAQAAGAQGQSLEDFAEEMREKFAAMGVAGDKVDRELEQLMATMIRTGEAGKATALSSKDLDGVIKSLGLQIRNTRSSYVNGRIGADEYRKTTLQLKDAIDGLFDSQVLTTDQQNKLNMAAATGQRGLDTLAGRASKLGLAQTVGIALQNQFNNTMGGMGPAGSAAAGALGLFSNALGSLQAPVTMADFHISKLLGGFAKVPGLIGLATAAFTGAALVGLVKLTNAAAETAGAILDGAAAVGLSTDAYQELGYAFQQSGLEAKQFDAAMQYLNRTLGDAAAGEQTAVKAFDRIGLSVRDAAGNIKGTEAVFDEIVDALVRMPSAATQASVAADFFGARVGAKLLPALADGKAGLEDLRRTARELGLVLSGDAVMTLEAYGDQMDTLKKQFETARAEIAAAFLPVMRDLLIPFLQNTVVPMLQNVARAVKTFADRLLDTGPAGAEFRAQMVKNLSPLFSFVDTVIGAGQGFLAFGNLVLGMAASIGAVLGTLSVQVEAFARQFKSLSEGIHDLQTGRVGRGLERLGNVDFSGIFDMDALGASFEAAAGTYLDRSLALAEQARERLSRAVSDGYGDMLEGVIGDLTTSLTAGVGNLFDEVDTGLGNTVGGATKRTVESILGDMQTGLDRANELSAAFGNTLEAETQRVKTSINLVNSAITGMIDIGVAGTDERVRDLVAQLQALTVELGVLTRDPFADAKQWVARLAAEVSLGVKSMREAFDLVNPRVKELREEAAAALRDFGMDSQQYQDAVGKLTILEGLLSKLDVSRELKLTPTVNIAEGIDITGVGAIATVLEQPLAMVRFLIHKFASDASDDLRVFRADYSDFVGNVALGANSVTAAMNTQAEAVNIFGDTLKQLIADGTDTQALFDSIARNPAFGMVLMTGPGEAKPQVGLMQAALKEQADAWAAAQAAMTEEQIAAAGERYRAATEEVERLKRFYEGVDLSIAPTATITPLSPLAQLGEDVKRSLDIAGTAARLFGTESGLAAQQVSIFESAIRRALELDPAADVSEWVAEYARLTAGLDAAAKEAEEFKRIGDALAVAQGQLADLTGTAPSQWDRLRKAFMDAAGASTITTAELDKALEAIEGLEKADAAVQALNRLTEALDIGTSITQGLTGALTGIRDGDLGGALDGLTQLGTAIGTAIGGPAVGALVQAIGQGLQAAVELFQVLGDLFTGDSPARRELAKSLTETIAAAVRSGIEEGVRGGDDWAASLRTGITESVYGALLDAFIQAAITSAIIQPFIDEFTKVLNKSGQEAAFAFLQANLGRVLGEAESAAAEIIAIFDEFFPDTGSQAAGVLGQAQGVFELPSSRYDAPFAQGADSIKAGADTFVSGVASFVDAAESVARTFNSGFRIETVSGRGVDAARVA